MYKRQLLFPDILSLGYLTSGTLPLFLILGAASVPFMWAIQKLMLKLPFIRRKLGLN